MEDHKDYNNFMRITLDLFKEIVDTLTPYLERQITLTREPLEVGLKLATIFRLLATGNSYHATK